MPPSRSGLSPKAIGWALLGQVFWVPRLAIHLHERWLAHQRAAPGPGRVLPSTPLARATPLSLDDLLGPAGAKAPPGSALDGGQALSGAGVLLSSAGSGAPWLLNRPSTVRVDAPLLPVPDRSSGVAVQGPGPAMAHTDAGLSQGLSMPRHAASSLLGGTVGLGDLQEGPMTPLELLDRSLHARRGDPLAPLPALW
ncbi:MAG: hypothetical protein ACKO0M_13980, partial [Cyanobium sp.]